MKILIMLFVLFSSFASATEISHLAPETLVLKHHAEVVAHLRANGYECFTLAEKLKRRGKIMRERDKVKEFFSCKKHLSGGILKELKADSYRPIIDGRMVPVVSMVELYISWKGWPGYCGDTFTIDKSVQRSAYNLFFKQRVRRPKIRENTDKLVKKKGNSVIYDWMGRKTSMQWKSTNKCREKWRTIGGVGKKGKIVYRLVFDTRNLISRQYEAKDIEVISLD